MYKITRVEHLVDKDWLMDVEAPYVARKAEPGQFMIAKLGELGERVPLTIADYNKEKGTITIVFQVVGASTEKYSHLKVGDYFTDIVGPLGRPSELVDLSQEELEKESLIFIARLKSTKCPSNSGPSTQANFTWSPTTKRQAPHIPVPSIIMGFMETMVGIPKSFVVRAANFIIITGPMAMQRVYFFPSSLTSFFKTSVTTPLAP